MSEIPLIEVANLRKAYGAVEVLHGISFQIAPGELVGFLGGNGAGKTTTMRILLGLLRATSGSARLFGQPCGPNHSRYRRDVGYLPGEVNFYPWLSGEATLAYYAAARGADCREEIRRLTELFQLDASKSVRKYSTGMKQKLGLIQALMHRPQLLILDEPTNGLDPLVRQSLMNELKQAVRSGRTVLLSSHTLGEVDELCDRAIVLRDGRLVENKSIAELRRRGLHRVEVWTKIAGDIARRLPSQARLLKSSESQLSLTWAGPVAELLEWLRGFPCDDLDVGKPGLDDLFMTYYQNGEGDAGR